MDLAPPESLREPVLAGDLFGEGDTVVCVVPIDLAAPKGRLILPQVQVLREILDGDAVAVTVKERELEAALSNLRRPPALVITDSQVILKVSGDVPDDVPLTTFSTLFARYKGDLPTLAAGAAAIDKLRDGDTVLMRVPEIREMLRLWRQGVLRRDAILFGLIALVCVIAYLATGHPFTTGLVPEWLGWVFAEGWRGLIFCLLLAGGAGWVHFLSRKWSVTKVARIVERNYVHGPVREGLLRALFRNTLPWRTIFHMTGASASK